MNIPFIDVKTQNKELKKRLLKRAGNIIDNADFIFGEDVKCFEKEFSAYCKSRFAVGVNSGTDALFLALLSLGVGPGDEVICPVYTYIATAFSVSYTGAKPVFADIDEKTFTISPQDLEKKITKKTKAVIVVHLYGQPAQMQEIIRIAKKHNIKVIEDAAQSHGAKVKNKKGQWRYTGAIGDIGCFSFYPTKNLGCCGDGGLVVTNNKRIYERLLMLRDQGRKGKNRYLHYIKGYNSRLDSIQAAFLREKLTMLDKWNEMRRKNAHLYSRLLSNIDGVITPFEPIDKYHVFHIYALLVKNRGRVYKELKARGVNAGIVYHCPLHLQKAYKELKYRRGDFPAAERVSKEILCLPMHAHLSKKQIYFIVKKIKECLFR